MINIILCGGVGTRLWPLSRKLLPKQFIKFTNSQSLLQQTVFRNENLCDETIMVSNKEHKFMLLEQCSEINATIKKFILEPVGRNTAAAISLAVLDLNKDDVVLVSSADHFVGDVESYKSSVIKAKELAEQGNLVTLGVAPTYPAIGYGYINHNKNNVIKFVEKPEKNTAEQYIKDGNYLWNSGIFCFKVGVFLEQMQKHSPDLLSNCVTAWEKSKQSTIGNNNIATIEPNIDCMRKIESISIDYALFEKSSSIKVVTLDALWSDVGCFDELIKIIEPTKSISTQSKNNFCFSSDNKLITLSGVEDLLIIDSDDALLVAKKGKSDLVKELVPKVANINKELTEVHSKAFRPWGSYQVLSELSEKNDGFTFKVKQIIVKPGKKLSLQRHKYRSEHWVVVQGVAEVTIGDKVFNISANESTYVPVKKIHRLANNSTKDVIIVEVQVGSYVGEDDIERIDDDFNRC